MRQHYSIIEAPEEHLVGEPLKVRISIPDPEYVGMFDWIGLYPSQVPTVPGVSNDRWLYIHQNNTSSLSPPRSRPSSPNKSLAQQNSIEKIRIAEQQENSQRLKLRRRSSSSEKQVQEQTPRVTKPPSLPMNEVELTFPPSKVPSHAGLFELRIHRNNGYGQPDYIWSIQIFDSRIHPIKRGILCLSMVVLVASFQHVLNEKGICSYTDPLHTKDVIDDLSVQYTTGINRYFTLNPVMAMLAQAISSLMVDGSMLIFIFVGAMRRSSIRPFLALFLFMGFRFVAQAAATIPCPPGFLWPHGEILGVKIPTLFVDYHPANDMFFSGHTGTIFVLGLEFYAMDYLKLSIVEFIVFLPYVSVLVVSFRVHRGIDVLAAVLAAIASCSVSKHFSDTIDRELLLMRRSNENEINAQLHSNLHFNEEEQSSSPQVECSLQILHIE